MEAFFIKKCDSKFTCNINTPIPNTVAILYQYKQPPSYCRALCSNKEAIDDSVEKLRALYDRLNLISNPMQI